MKRLFIGIATVALFAACSHDQKRAEAPQTPQQQAQAQLAAERTNYVNQTQSRIDQITKYSADLKSRAATAGKPNDKKMQNAAEDLDSLLADAKKNLGEVQSAAPENWIDYKRDVEKSMARVESQYSNSVSLIR